jgi:Ca2+/H+ antiporter
VLYRLVRIVLALLTIAAMFLTAFLMAGDLNPARALTHLIAVAIVAILVYRASLVLPEPTMRRAFPPFTKMRL